MNIGFIGLGLMGRPMAINVARGGHTLHIWARRAASLEPFAIPPPQASAPAAPPDAVMSGPQVMTDADMSEACGRAGEVPRGAARLLGRPGSIHPPYWSGGNTGCLPHRW